MSEQLQLNLVNGELVAAPGGATIDVTDPATDGQLVGRVPAMTAEDVHDVFEYATIGARVWRDTGHLQRGRILLDASALIRSEAARLTEIIVSEMGKTRAEAAGEVGKAAEFFEYYGALARLPFGETIPDGRPSTFATQTREPLGVVLLITPWNDPLLTPARKLGPALLAGNAVVLKPSTDTPLIALALADILNRAGLPAGVLGTVTGRGRDIGDALLAHPALRAVSFTGSTEVGLDLQRSLAGRNVRVQTEMGGKNAAVVLDDADLDLAVSTVIAASFAQAGQRCTATSRVIVQSGIAESFRTALADAVTALRVGAGADEGTQVSPVVSMRARDEIVEHIERALGEGAEELATAPLTDAQRQVGAYVAPRLLGADTSMAIWRDEVFGPVVALTVVNDLDDAINLVNDSRYGLSSSVFTRSLENAYRFINGVDTGQVSVNLPTSGWDVHQPFGGFKESGSPFKEQGLVGLQFYTRVKTAAIRTA